MIPRDKKLFPGILLGAGIAATLASGLLLLLLFSHPNNAYLSGPGSPTYGFPFPWTGILNSSSDLDSFNWLGFLADVSFYMALAYLIVIAYEQELGRQEASQPERFGLAAGIAAGWVVAAIFFSLIAVIIEIFFPLR